MKLTLESWKRRWQSITFDTVNGIGSVRWLSRKPTHCSGWALKNHGNWYALWSQNGYLIFQAGSKQWPMTDSYTCKNIRHGNERVFTISTNGRQEFELRYQVMDRDYDPTFDIQELEMSDFFYWTAWVWIDSAYKKELAASWSRSDV